MTERRPIPGWEGFYEACAEGHVYSVPRSTTRKNGGNYTVRARRMKPYTNEGGYKVLHLRKHGLTIRCLAHRCVLAAFAQEPPAPRNLVNHKNGVTGDNRVENLEWCNKSENALHAYRVLGRPRPTPKKGAESSISKAVVALNPSTGEKLRFDWMGAAVAAGFKAPGISSAISGAQKTHRGLIWSLA